MRRDVVADTITRTNGPGYFSSAFFMSFLQKATKIGMNFGFCLNQNRAPVRVISEERS